MPVRPGYSDTLGFMLDCDKCHRWFHGACVGVPAAETELPEVWHCDHCLSIAVHDQRQRISRLLELPFGGHISHHRATTTEARLLCSETET